MKFPAACVIGCTGLVLAGIACLFFGVNPGVLYPAPASPDGGRLEEITPPFTHEAGGVEPKEEKKPDEGREARGQSPGR